MGKNILAALIIAVVIVLVALGGWYGYSVWSRVDAQQQAELSAEEREAYVKTLAYEFELILDGLLTEVQEESIEYRKERKVLNEITQPENLVDRTYVEGNYALMQSLIPSIRESMNDIMQAFEEADERVRTLLLDVDEEMQISLLQEWDALKEQQAATYIAFFAVEDELIEAQSALMNFYYDRMGEFSYNETTGNLEFENPADKEAEKRLRLLVKQLSLKQAMILSRDIQSQADSEQMGEAVSEQDAEDTGSEVSEEQESDENGENITPPLPIVE
jgi:hypothetical protein